MSLRHIMHCCSKCKALCNDEFKPIINLKSSGLVIYAHNNKMETKEKDVLLKIPSFVLHNTGKKELKKFDYIIELCQYKTKCFQCQRILQRIRKLLDDVNIIRKNEVLAVCDYCKRSNFKTKCKRCEYLLEKFMTCCVQREKVRDEYEIWWQNVKKTLVSILDVKKTCPHRVCFVENSDTELIKLINLLKSSSPKLRPIIETFPKKELEISVPIDEETKEVLLGVIDDMNLDSTSSDSILSDNSSCLCKYFDDRKKRNEQKEVSQDLPVIKENETGQDISTFGYQSLEISRRKSEQERLKLTASPDVGQSNKLDRTKNKKLGKTNDLPTKPLEKDDKQTSQDKNKIDKDKKTKDKEEENVKESKTKAKENQENSPEKSPVKKVDKTMDKFRMDPEYQLILQLIKEHKKEAKAKERTKSALQILKRMPKIPDLPPLPVRPPPAPRNADDESEITGNIVVCTPKETLPKIKIYGTKTVPLDTKIKNKGYDQVVPLIFQTKYDCKSPETSSCSSKSSTDKLDEVKRLLNMEDGRGVTKYVLSDKRFIDKGWTRLPSTKVMRRLNVYKMEPSNNKLDWFKMHCCKRELFYDSGELLAEVNPRGRGGKWFYKNGLIALDFHYSQNCRDKQRYIIYGYNNDENKSNNVRKVAIIMACFDYLGNGIVFDNIGNPRLKYNQTEGIIIDDKLGPPGKWKWHTLNDPPVLQNVYVDNVIKDDTMLRRLLNHEDYKLFCGNDSPKSVDEEMVAIELDNFVKEKATKLMQKFKPFKIRMKAVKINEYFSLRIIDQANIYVLFRCGRTNLKLNIGMKLLSNEIIDSIMVEVSEVATPYDDITPDTKSLCDIQELLQKQE